MIEKINQLEKGAVISESPHYIVDRVAGSTVHLKHFESGEDVQTDKESGIRPVNISTIKMAYI